MVVTFFSAHLRNIHVRCREAILKALLAGTWSIDRDFWTYLVGEFRVRDFAIGIHNLYWLYLFISIFRNRRCSRLIIDLFGMRLNFDDSHRWFHTTNNSSYIDASEHSQWSDHPLIIRSSCYINTFGKDWYDGTIQYLELMKTIALHVWFV